MADTKATPTETKTVQEEGVIKTQETPIDAGTQPVDEAPGSEYTEGMDNPKDEIKGAWPDESQKPGGPLKQVFE